jgi:hypothetical protein
MVIDSEVERPARTMLGHAIRGELEDLAALIEAEGIESVERVIDLCTFAAGYIAIDVIGMRWPTERMLRKIANSASKSATLMNVTEEEIFEFLARVALGKEQVDDVFSIESVGAVPIYSTATLLLTFCPEGRHWVGYLDQIEDAAEISGRLSPTVLPGLMLRVRKSRQLAPAPAPNPPDPPGGLSPPGGSWWHLPDAEDWLAAGAAVVVGAPRPVASRVNVDELQRAGEPPVELHGDQQVRRRFGDLDDLHDRAVADPHSLSWCRDRGVQDVLGRGIQQAGSRARGQSGHHELWPVPRGQPDGVREGRVDSVAFHAHDSPPVRGNQFAQVVQVVLPGPAVVTLPAHGTLRSVIDFYPILAVGTDNLFENQAGEPQPARPRQVD